MTKQTVSFRADKNDIQSLDLLAKMQDRDRSRLLNEAVANYIELQEWQLEHIRAGLAEAKAGIFVSDEDMQETFKSLRQRLIDAGG